MFLSVYPLMDYVQLGSPAPSLTYYYENRGGFLGEDLVIESPVLTGNIKWSVIIKKSYKSNKLSKILL